MFVQNPYSFKQTNNLNGVSTRVIIDINNIYIVYLYPDIYILNVIVNTHLLNTLIHIIITNISIIM